MEFKLFHPFKVRSPIPNLTSLICLGRRFEKAQSGNVAITFTAGAAGIIGIAGAALDFAAATALEARLQAVADAAAVASARELYLSNSKRRIIKAVAVNFVDVSLGDDIDGVSKKVDVSPDFSDVTVSLEKSYDPKILSVVYKDQIDIAVSSTATIMPGGRICAIALEPSKGYAIEVDWSARFTADQCAVFSNSTSRIGIRSRYNAKLKSELTCSAGGYFGLSRNFDPVPETDCPPIEDPLANRKPPAPEACRETGLTISAGQRTLKPGTYCGGVTITGTADVKLTDGIYVFKDGPLTVNGTATLEGAYVGFYFTGADSTLFFDSDTTISLTAPKQGAMAGILMFEDRASPPERLFNIRSDNARELLGTIYLPRAKLLVDGNQPVADRSAYTAIIVRILELKAGPHLVLNSDYTSTDVPVPPGIGPVGGNIRLIE
ncbi:MAG: pilus assembly protein TadG-related protein [Pseudomonadota bacterium]